MDKSELLARYRRLVGFLKQDLDNSKLFQDCFDLAIQIGELDGAAELLASRPQQFANDPLTLYCESKLALANQDFDKAKEISQSMLDQGINDLAIHYNVSWADFSLANYEDVLKNIEALGEHKQDYPPFLILEARALHHLGRVEEAIFLTRHFVEQNTQSDEALGLLSLLLLDSENYAESTELANAARQLNPSNHESLIALTSIALNDQKADETEAILNTNLELAQKSGRLMLNLGQAQMLNMNFDQAEDSLEQASQLMGNHIGTWHALAWVKIVKGKIADAKMAFQKAYDLDRNFAESHGGLAIVAVHEKRFEDAEKLTKTSLRLDPMCRSGRYAEVLLLEHKGNKNRGRDKNDGLDYGRENTRWPIGSRCGRRSGQPSAKQK